MIRRLPPLLHLPASQVRFEQIDDFDASFQNLRTGIQIFKFWCITVDAVTPMIRSKSLTVIDRVTQYIEHATQCVFTDRH